MRVAPAPVRLPEPVVAPPMFAAPRDSRTFAQTDARPVNFAPGPRNSLRSVVLVAGSVALLTSLLTLGVRGLQNAPPSASAARLALDPSATSQRAESQETRAVVPMVTPLTPSPRRRAALRDQSAALAPKPPQALPLETRATDDEPFVASDVASIAASIREGELRRARALARPRLLRVELPENPY